MFDIRELFIQSNTDNSFGANTYFHVFIIPLDPLCVVHVYLCVSVHMFQTFSKLDALLYKRCLCRFLGPEYHEPFKRQIHKMVKHTQTICR